MIASDLQIIDRPTITAPLGLRFWDTVLDTPVGAGLDVVVFPPANPGLQTSGTSNTTGIYVFHHLPGLRSFERGAGDAAFWASLPPPKSFVVQVQDPSGRFLPCQFEVEVPLVGIAPFVCGSPLQLASVPLFSAPTRQPPPGMAVVRAELLDTSSGRPAAFALLELRLSTTLAARGAADAQGRIVLFLAYPEPTGFAAGSPMSGGGRALTDQMWTLDLTAAYSPSASAQIFPDQCATLNQAPALLWSDAAQTRQFTQAPLRFGQELILRSGVLPNLLVTPTGSPV
jgi:hypothetical protein